MSVARKVIRNQSDWKGTHPAEVAARHLSKKDPSGGGSDEQIKQDLRKLVFSVPMMPQEELLSYFESMDSLLIPSVHDLIYISESILNDVLQIIVKVAAGNTYGKNIYEKEDTPEELKGKSRPRTTYKPHEEVFMLNSYDFLRKISTKKYNKQQLTNSVKKIQFIRGVYEELLEKVLEETKDYTKFHWEAISSKLCRNWDKHYRSMSLVSQIEQKLRISSNDSYNVIRRAHLVYERFLETRSIIISPFLRVVFKRANNTAKNSHQMLDNFQNGAIGLMRAVSCYSTVRLASFSSVAKWWIKQAMLLSIKEDANFVKLPIATWQLYTQLEKKRTERNIDEDDFEAIASIAKLPVEKIKGVYDSVKLTQVYSLNKTYDHNEKLTLEDIIPTYEEDEDDIQKNELRRYCMQADLTNQERKMLALQYGMLDIIPLTNINQRDVLKQSLHQHLKRIGFTISFPL